MLEFLQKEYNYTTTGLTVDEKKELEQLRQEIQKYRQIEQGIGNEEQELENNNNNSDLSGNESEEEEKLDQEFEQRLKKRQQKGHRKRTAVSAEVYGEFNKKENFIARFIPKTEDQIKKIKQHVLISFLFSNLDQKELDIVIGAMEEKRYDKGEYVIKQGDQGDSLYVVESGSLDCTKVFHKGERDTYLKTYQPGESFGELALLYNVPRAASIKANEQCVLWMLDRETFTNIVKDAELKKREKYENFLKKVDILSTIDSYELMQICDALKTETFKKGDYIIREGECGDLFYILEEGMCIATKALEPGKPAQEIKKYSEGEYFGERALIKGEPRYANIEVVSDIVKVISLDRNSFKRLLGPIEPLLKRNMEQYTKFITK